MQPPRPQSMAMGYPAQGMPFPATGGDAEMRDRRMEYSGAWSTGAIEAPIRRPLAFCCALCCGPCVSYALRKRALHGDMTRYTCCAGAFPCSGSCGEARAPECCLALETCCCFGTSVAATRFLIQDEMRLANTKTDACLFGTQFAIAQCACLCSIAACLTGSDEVAQLANCLTCVADAGYCLLCGCLQAQHYDALETRDAASAAGRLAAGTQLTPPAAQVWAHPATQEEPPLPPPPPTKPPLAKT